MAKVFITILDKEQLIARVWEVLQSIPDPEIPVINVVELGVIRRVGFVDGAVEIDITPTYSGCPAMFMIEADIQASLAAAGFHSIKLNRVLSPAWTTDWLTEASKQKLKAYGIAPPSKLAADKVTALVGGEREVCCPRCNSGNTKLLSEFGSTACKALWFCNECREPFDYFKCH